MSPPDLAKKVAPWGLGVLIALGVFLSTFGERGPETPGSIESSRGNGRQVAFQLLRGLDFEPEAWRRAPMALPAGQHVLWLAEIPDDFDAGGGEPYDWQGEELDPSLADPRHPRNYASFVEQGGTLILRAGPVDLEWLAEDVGIVLPSWNKARRDGLAALLDLDTDESLLVSYVHSPGDEAPGPPERDERWRDLATDREGGSFAAWIPVGSGRVVLLADDHFVKNDRIGQNDNGLFLVRLMESLDRGGRLMFDEYALGLWSPPSAVALLATPGLLEVTLHALLLALLVVLYAAWAREFPRDPDPIPTSPRVRAAAQARLLERARRFDLLATDLRLGVLRRLVRHFKLGRASRNVLREDGDPEAIAAVVREVAAQAGSTDEGRWTRLFLTREIESRRQLEALSGALNEIEIETQLRGRGPTRGRRPRR